MGYSKRKGLYQAHEKKRKRPLIVYVTSIRQNMPSQMATDAIPTIIEQINQIPQDKKEVDFLIISNGGDPIMSLRTISILRERFNRVSVIVPFVAFSAATILALGADEIVMHPYSNLGPLDPQLSIVKPNAQGQPAQIQFSSEDIRSYIEFIRSDVGISDPEQLIAAFNSLAAEVGPVRIGTSKRSQLLSMSLSTKMLETHLGDKEKAEEIAKALNMSYFHHGYAVGRREAKDMGLNVILPEKELEDIMWSIWQDFSNEMKCNQPFDPISEVMSNPAAKQAMTQLPVVSMPMNTPPPIAQNMLAQLSKQHAQVTQQSPIEFSQPMAAIESLHRSYAFNNRFTVVYWREPNMALSYNVTAHSKGWELASV